jgi:hypothetical protein
MYTTDKVERIRSKNSEPMRLLGIRGLQSIIDRFIEYTNDLGVE